MMLASLGNKTSAKKTPTNFREHKGPSDLSFSRRILKCSGWGLAVTVNCVNAERRLFEEESYQVLLQRTGTAGGFGVVLFGNFLFRMFIFTVTFAKSAISSSHAALSIEQYLCFLTSWWFWQRWKESMQHSRISTCSKSFPYTAGSSWDSWSVSAVWPLYKLN